jgi:hypothetical protein
LRCRRRRGSRSRRRDSRGQSERPKLKHRHIRVFAIDAYLSMKCRIKQTWSEREEQDQQDVDQDGDHQRLGSGCPKLQLRVLIEQHGLIIG